MTSNIEMKIKNLMSVVFNIAVDDINKDSTSDTIKNWDSLTQIRLVALLEEEFDLEFSGSEIMEVMSFKSIYKRIKG